MAFTPNIQGSRITGSISNVSSISSNFTGSLLGTASFALTASSVTALSQSVTISGNVGIGTTSPTSSLHVKLASPATNGQTAIMVEANAGISLNMLSDNYNSGQALVTLGRLQSSMNGFLAYGVDATGSATSAYQSSQDAAAIRPTALEVGNGIIALKYNTTSSVRTVGTNVSMATSLYMEGATGRIGIGTQTPQAILHVSTSGYNEQYPFLIGLNTFAISASGNIGIGKTTPNATLDVSGSVIISGSVTATSLASATTANVVYYNTSTGLFTYGSAGTVTSASYASTASISATATTASYALTASYVANASSFPYTGSAQITGSLGITGSININTGSISVYSYSGSKTNYPISIFNTSADVAMSITHNQSVTPSSNRYGINIFMAPTGSANSAIGINTNVLTDGSSATALGASLTAQYIGASPSGKYAIGADIRASGAQYNYSLRLLDGSEGYGKVLTCVVPGDGFASWVDPNTLITPTPAFPYTGSAVITGSLTVTGSITSTNTLYIANSASIGVSAPISGIRFLVNTVTTNQIGIRGQSTYIGVQGVGTIDNGTVYGVQGIATDNGSPYVTSNYIGGYMIANATGGNNYALQAVDGTEGIGKVLVSQTADGKANWSTRLTGPYEVTGSLTVTGTLNAPIGSGNNSVNSNLLAQAAMLFLANNC